MSSSAFASRTLKTITGLVLFTVGVVGAQGSDAGATRSSHRIVESSACRGNRHIAGHIEHGSRQDSGDGLKQVMSVRVPATTFLRVDDSGRVTSAATNTGCRPGKQDDVFLLRPDGAIEQATPIALPNCHWVGDFTVPGVFQPQLCGADGHGHQRND